MQDRRKQTAGGFTLIELLVVVAIIALLTGLFAVGTQRVKIIGRGLQQKSEFHAMTVGLELFSGDFDGYPRSATTTGVSGLVTGAQHLTEALLGRDERGFEPQTNWYPPDIGPPPADLYDTQTPGSRSLARRKGPYCEIKYGQILTIYDLWGGANGPSAIYDSASANLMRERSPIITDVFNRNSAADGSRVGMPILYFKADSTKQQFRVDADRQRVRNPVPGTTTPNGYGHWVYNFDDNLPVLELPWLRDTAAWPSGLDVHYQDPDGGTKNQAQVFYEQITQTADPDRDFYRPYNGTTFILISAGWDGIFGTKDDIVNFD